MQVFKKIVCADGFSLSVQASGFHYCQPREDRGPYTSVEAGFPTGIDEALQEFAENPEEGLVARADGSSVVETVYPYVPARVIAALLERHGGVASGDCPELDIRGEEGYVHDRAGC